MEIVHEALPDGVKTRAEIGGEKGPGRGRSYSYQYE
jgi:hypothetical protein